VQVAFVDDLTAVRDSKDPDGPTLYLTRGNWDAFVRVKNGKFGR
jgi:hypothetical protein